MTQSWEGRRMGFRSSEILRQRSGAVQQFCAQEAFAKSALSLRSYYTRHFIVSIAEQLSSLPLSSLDFLPPRTNSDCDVQHFVTDPLLGFCPISGFYLYKIKYSEETRRQLNSLFYLASCSLFSAFLYFRLYFKSRSFFSLFPSFFFIFLDIVLCIVEDKRIFFSLSNYVFHYKYQRLEHAMVFSSASVLLLESLICGKKGIRNFFS